MIQQPVTGYKTLRVFGWGFALIWTAFFVTLVFALADAPHLYGCLLYTSPSPRDRQKSRMPSSA